jgi:quinohemoprotein ethanol dehydrogenase
MSFNPVTGLAYLPAQNIPFNIKPDAEWTLNSVLPGRIQSGTGMNLGVLAGAPGPENKPFGRLIAWDPVARKEVWSAEFESPWNGGTLTTAGNLVFQGTADGRFVAYNALSGEKLWESPVGTGIVAAPMTYEIDGRQFVSIAVGWGGVYGLFQRAADKIGPGTVFTYALGSDAPLPDFAQYPVGTLVSGVAYNADLVSEGSGLYFSHCFLCHGAPGVNNGGNIRNLGTISADVLTKLDNFLFDGPMLAEGMPDFTGKLSHDEVEKIKAYIQSSADSARGQ